MSEQQRDEAVRIVAYDPAWPARFELERATLQRAIGDWAPGGIHHVGSTAVPATAAKPIIDILVGVLDLPSTMPCIQLLAPLGYLYAPYRSEQMHWFCKPHPSRRTHHLHLVPRDSARFRDELLFRDTLRERRELAERYGTLKRTLAREFRRDRERYTQAKAEFILDVLRDARSS